MICFKNKNLTINGDYYSTDFKYIEIKLLKCTKNCVNTTTELNAFFEPLSFSVAFINSYFDYSDFENTVKPFIDDSLFWELEPGK